MPTYLADDGNAEIEITADTPQEAAQKYVDGGDWGECGETDWIKVRVTETDTCYCDGCAGCDDSERDDAPCGDPAVGLLDGKRECPVCEECGSHHQDTVKDFDPQIIKIALEPSEPECEDGEDHDWQSPIDIVGGCEESPGVHLHGGGVTITSVCMRCGTERTEDTWAQDSSDGEQGLDSVSYEGNKYADEVAALAAEE